MATKHPQKWLLNSAVMAAGAYGTYEYSPATAEDLRELVAGPYCSRIGYPETAAHVERLTGHRPALSREPSVLEPGDEAIVVRLRYRVDPGSKETHRPNENSWEIARIRRLA